MSNVISEYAADHYDRTTINEIPKSEIELNISDKLFLDFMLMKIRAKTISFATMKRKKMREHENKLIRCIETWEESESKTENEVGQLKELNLELETIRAERMKGVLLRSKARWVADGEKMTKYFCSLEKRNYVSKQMTKLETKDGKVIEDQRDMIDEVKMFYGNLYKERRVDDCEIENVIKHVPKLSSEEQELLDGEITLNEASLALRNMKNGKSPGTDGFTS
jgi:hypothetical protein